VLRYTVTLQQYAHAYIQLTICVSIHSHLLVDKMCCNDKAEFAGSQKTSSGTLHVSEFNIASVTFATKIGIHLRNAGLLSHAVGVIYCRKFDRTESSCGKTAENRRQSDECNWHTLF
jgi:hypothetical protein